jgi:hypothetical protein
MPILYTENELKNFREQLYERFEHRADSTMDLLGDFSQIKYRLFREFSWLSGVEANGRGTLISGNHPRCHL